MLGCLAALFLLLAIVLRCIQVGMKSPDYMNRLICIGIASMLLFQILINVGVCLGLFPVVGLALPFLSYGGSSILTSFLAMGIVSGIKMRPRPRYERTLYPALLTRIFRQHRVWRCCFFLCRRALYMEHRNYTRHIKCIRCRMHFVIGPYPLPCFNAARDVPVRAYHCIEIAHSRSAAQCQIPS